MSRVFHVGLDLRGFLRTAKFPKDYRRMFKHPEGRSMTPDEARDQILDELSKGRAMIPYGPCDNFDYQTGCRGHEERSGS